ncbi:dihydrofolate reductase [Fulvimarina sp. 2208YS6-2-32]|uniref:Dihydrofolate reductase n=1 Tax=Fulvimarina uroteuthidis TaxID=3098149 RepID=A0ABU5I076_9HYPH|nr:dihydrofolate reductase [Fulvimarina sp. 2208YS6-2-32]MDY8108611.1 dihydrofolate reductase [Fulvimarina sp. 2208YS6-2-32]
MIGPCRLIAVVAAAKNAVIGADGVMPWSIPSDLKRYRQLTMGKPMIMGRKTLDSIGRVLDGRDSIVLTRAGPLAIDGAIAAHDPRTALALAADRARARGTEEITLVGGAEIYRLFWDRIDRIALTEIDAEPEGDAFFPPIEEARFECLSVGPWERGEKDSAATRFKCYARRTPSEQD